MRGGGKDNLQGVMAVMSLLQHYTEEGLDGVCQIGRTSDIRFRDSFHSMKLTKMDSTFRQSHGRDFVVEHLSKLGQYQPIGPM